MLAVEGEEERQVEFEEKEKVEMGVFGMVMEEMEVMKMGAMGKRERARLAEEVAEAEVGDGAEEGEEAKKAKGSQMVESRAERIFLNSSHLANPLLDLHKSCCSSWVVCSSKHSSCKCRDRLVLISP